MLHTNAEHVVIGRDALIANTSGYVLSCKEKLCVSSLHYKGKISKDVMMSHYTVFNIDTEEIFEVVYYDTVGIDTLPWGSDITLINGRKNMYYDVCIKNAIDVYHKMLWRWLHLYKYVVLENQLGCTDLFANIVLYYITSYI